MSDPIVLLYTTFPNAKVAEQICSQLVQERVIACANILSPLTALYFWRGKQEKAQEIPALLKTTRRMFVQVELRLKALHPYEVPCLIEVPTGLVGRDYESWLRSELMSTAAQPPQSPSPTRKAPAPVRKGSIVARKQRLKSARLKPQKA